MPRTGRRRGSGGPPKQLQPRELKNLFNNSKVVTVPGDQKKRLEGFFRKADAATIFHENMPADKAPKALFDRAVALDKQFAGTPFEGLLLGHFCDQVLVVGDGGAASASAAAAAGKAEEGVDDAQVWEQIQALLGVDEGFHKVFLDRLYPFLIEHKRTELPLKAPVLEVLKILVKSRDEQSQVRSLQILFYDVFLELRAQKMLEDKFAKTFDNIKEADVHPRMQEIAVAAIAYLAQRATVEGHEGLKIKFLTLVVIYGLIYRDIPAFSQYHEALDKVVISCLSHDTLNRRLLLCKEVLKDFGPVQEEA